MNRFLHLAFAVLLGVSGAAFAAQNTWVNNGSVTLAPAIDATNVINNGTMLLVTTLPFDTSNTRNFTNSGTMLGSIGFRFDTAPRNSTGQLIGLRKPAENFHNRNSGVIQALDGSALAGFNGSLLLVDATNIINQGLMTVGAGGLLKLTGTNVNISRGGTGVVSVDGDAALLGSFNDAPVVGQFYPDLGVTDRYWAQTNDTFRVDTLISPDGTIRTPVHRVEGVDPAGNLVQEDVVFQLGNYWYDAISNVTRYASVTLTNIDGSVTNFMVASNVVMQAAFVGVTDPTVPASIRFVPSSMVTNDYWSVFVTLAFPSSNVLTGELDGSSIVYFHDELAGEAERRLLINYLTTVSGAATTRTRRPSAYILSRLDQTPFFAQPGNSDVGFDFFYSDQSGTNVVTGEFAAYMGEFDNILVRPPAIPAGTATNNTGRAEVRSHTLNMTEARMRGEGLISLQTDHLIDSAGAVLDCENLSFDLGSTNGLLRIQDLTKMTVQRLRGGVRAWSAQWSNTVSLIMTNYDVSDTNEPPVEQTVTNTVNILYHMLVYDTSFLQTTVPVAIQQFRARATNIVMEDDANIALDFLLQGESFTLNGNVSMAGRTPNWVSSNAPSLQYFTNNGSLSVLNEAHFGDDTETGYLSFINRGIITAEGQNINSKYVELSGINRATAAFAVIADDARIESGRIESGGDIIISAETLKLNRAFIQTSTRLVLDIDSSLADNGFTSSNTISFRDGISLPTKPALGDLLGSTLQTIAPMFGLVDHIWAGEDRGPTAAGFLNNVAVGRLTFTSLGSNTKFGFAGAGDANGLYVDLLDLSQLANFANQLVISPNLTIYYAAARLSFVPPGGVTPEEYLDQQFGGRLRWVPQYAGPNSSVDVVINGNQTIQVNRALRNSQIIDSDSDGIPNYFDLTPFDGVLIGSISINASPVGYVITWNAAPDTSYRVEYKEDPTSPTWKFLSEVVSEAAVIAPLSVLDTNVSSGQQRYYRVSYTPRP